MICYGFKNQLAMRRTASLDDVKIESDVLEMLSSRQNNTVSSSARVQSYQSDAKVFEIKFMENIAKTQQLKNEVCDKFTDYEKQLKLEETQRLSLQLALKEEKENSRYFEEQLTLEVTHRLSVESDIQEEKGNSRHLEKQLNEKEKENQNLTEQVITLTQSNKSLSEENAKMTMELRQSNDKVESLVNDLNINETLLNDLNNDYQKLLMKKAAFNKNYERLKVFVNDLTFPGAHNSNISPLDKTDDSVNIQKENKRSYEDEASTSKRLKPIDPIASSYDPNDVSTFDYVEENELLQHSQPDCDEPMCANADSTNNVDSDCGAVKNDNLAAMAINQEIETPFQEKRRNIRKNISKIMDFEKLTPETKLAYQQEKERKKQYVQRLQRYNETYGRLPGERNKYKLVLDFDFNSEAEMLVVDKKLSKKLKLHQFEGVKFMWDACFESIDKLQHSSGSGCILSHCMGLGKTFQVVTLAHTLLTHSVTKVEKVLVICPVNVILNWVDEFDIWLKHFPKDENIKIYEVSTCNSDERINRMKTWHKNGGVFIIGYHLFQAMYKDVERKKSNATDTFLKACVNPGADLVVCDEGHLLKNPTSQLSLALNKIRTSRRIILTGTPIQNNLKEYFTMVEFVKPRLLGTEKEFNNRFVGPILNGQYVDSTDEDITLMKYRACILHKLLEGCVHRRDYAVLAKYLPPKQEYALFIRLTKEQIDLYKFYVAHIVERNAIVDWPALRKVCNHPKVLADSEDRRKRKQLKTKERSDATISDTKSELWKNCDKHNEWWKPMCSGEELEMSSKMLILSSILSECEARDEKLIVFSGCLSTLNVIEHFLAKISEETQRTLAEEMQNSRTVSSTFKGIWIRNVDYSRLDGTQSADKRKQDITRFNEETNARTRLFLISTKAGSLGINLMAANRVVIFDASWNPSDDIQSIFRSYRIGQTKQCFVYRFVGLGTMEETLYERQVSKLSMAKRVVDEQQIGRHYKEHELQNFYCVDNLDPPTVNHQASSMTKDNVLNSLLQKHRDLIFKYHDHDSLLVNIKEETLTDEEVGDVWDEFDSLENVNSGEQAIECAF